MPHDEMRTIAKEAAHEAVNEMLEKFGVDIEHPLEMQEDFAFMRSYRKLSQRVGSRVIMTIVTLVTAGIGGLVWTQIRK